MMVRTIRSGWSLLVILALSGCDFTPPPPPELSAAAPAFRSAAPMVELILDGSGGTERTLWTDLGQLNAASARVIFREASPGPGDPPARQVELIRDAVAHGASALLVVPADAPQVAEALNEAREKGVAVLLLDRALPPGGGGKPFPLITFAPFGPSARELVAAAARGAKQFKLPDDGGAVILANRRTDRHSAERIAALKDALKDANVPLRETITFADGTQEADSLLREKLKADPKITIVLAEEDEGFWAGAQAADALQAERPFVMAGYLVFGIKPTSSALHAATGAVNRNFDGLMRQALDAAVRLVEGKPVPDRTEVLPMFHQGAQRIVGSQKAPQKAQPVAP